VSNAEHHITYINHGSRRFYFLFPSREDHICKVMEETGTFYENSLLQAAARAIEPGDIVLDIGANVGTHTLYFAGVCGANVHAFEPVEATFSLLSENVRINGLTQNVVLRQVAVGAQNSAALVADQPANNSGAARLSVDPSGPIRVVPIDGLIDELARVALIKIDVEGMELDVLRGCRQLIERDRPVLVCECATEEALRPVAAFLDEINYSAIDIYNATPTYLFVPTMGEELGRGLRRLLGTTMLHHREEIAKAASLARRALQRVDASGRQIQNLEDLPARLTAQMAAAAAKLEGNFERDFVRNAALAEQMRGAQASDERVSKALAEVSASLRVLEAKSRDTDARLQTMVSEHASISAHLDEIEQHQSQVDESMQADLSHLMSQQVLSKKSLDELGDRLRRRGVDEDNRYKKLSGLIFDSRKEHRIAGRVLQRGLDELAARHENLLNSRLFRGLKTAKRAMQVFGLFRNRTPATPPPAASSVAAQLVVNAARHAQVPPTTPDAERTTNKNAEGIAGQANSAPPASSAAVPSAAISLPKPDRIKLAHVPYMTRPKNDVRGAEVVYEGRPLISVVMTAFNTGALVDAAIRSILDQTWVNLELIVVDDCSSDDTRDRIQRIAKTDPRLFLYCFGENRGTYWCKNFGIAQSKGHAITFMDSDDLSHPTRVERQFAALNRPGFAVSTCNHIRVDESGKTIEINGIVERVAYISQMVKRSVIEEIGYFDTTRTSADDEFLRRIKFTYGAESHTNVKTVLYTALLRGGSLTSDPENAINFVQERNVQQTFLSPQRKHYAAMVSRWHDAVHGQGLRPYMPFPVVRRPFPVFGKLQIDGERFNKNMISVCLASYPPRADKLLQAVASLLPQVDRIYIYLNEYEAIPDFLKHKQITVELAGKDRNLRDNGKFFFMKSIPTGYVFTIDDDIMYPDDYIQVMIRKLEFYDRKAIVGLHGTVFGKPFQRYFRKRILYHFEHALEHDVIVNQLGTGTMAFHSSLICPDVSAFQSSGMVDVWFALAAKAADVPMIAVQRESRWLKPIGLDEATLFREFRKDDTMQTKLISAAAPWSETLGSALDSFVHDRRVRLGDAYSAMLPRPRPTSTIEDIVADAGSKEQADTSTIVARSAELTQRS
jgi:FkbM family methyltransferase